MSKNILFILAFFLVCTFSTAASGQINTMFYAKTARLTAPDSKNLITDLQPRTEDYNSGSSAAPLPIFTNPTVLNQKNGCRADNLNFAKFSNDLSSGERLTYCQAVESVSAKLSQNWSPELRNEIQQIWTVFANEKVKIRPMKKNLSSRILAAAEAFTEPAETAGFNASFYLRANRADDKSFLLVFMHEMRHVADFYALWKTHGQMTEADLEMRGFRIMGKIYQEMADKPYFFSLPTFWEDDWKNLSAGEIEERRTRKIEKFMRGNGFYKSLMKSPSQHTVGYAPTQTAAPIQVSAAVRENNGEKLPVRLQINQTKTELAQNVKELAFTPEKNADENDPNKLLRAALVNERNLYYKMNNFVYDQNLQLQCWKKQKVTENYLLNNQISRTENGEALLQKDDSAAAKLPTCVLNMDLIKSDATETFWAAPYLEKMPIKFDSFTEVAGVKAARYTVYQPTMQKFDEMAAQYPHIKNFRAFVGTIYVSVADAQIIKFWGTSFPEAAATGYQAKRTFGSYCATAIRQKLASGIWVTSLVNTVAVTNDNDKMKPFSYVVKYQNYRQGTTDVKILDDDETAAAESVSVTQAFKK